MDKRVIEICTESRAYWYPNEEPAKCTDPAHSHQHIEVHRHCSPLTLPDGTSITAVSFDPTDPYSREQTPDHGFYLDSRWQPPWPHDLLDWPDFGVPRDSEAVATVLRSALDRARAGDRIEIGCLGGHGRTGTALACLAILAGQPAGTAVSWVRRNYCPRAVETAEQEAFVADFSG